MSTGRKATRKKSTAKRAGRVERGIIEGLNDAIAFERGDGNVGRVLTARRAEAAPAPTFTKGRVIDLRHRLGISQPVFAQALNVSNDTVRGWEQGRNPPSGAAARLLELVEENPDLVLRKVSER
ncbi:MAG TPA: helix-turn-helix domain-containing protein [Burkholderiales bacterium]|nr:helix-turn-helix domain-containing protein [Burkholderiales bacterium]